MNWLNLNITVLDSEEFLGADPVQRATWLCLLRYCIGQENGGRIKGAKDWTDRKWQQVVRVTQTEASAMCDLWAWDDGDLVVAFYPNDKEAEIQQLREFGKLSTAAKREAARANGSKGGRPKRNPTETQRDETQGNPTETQQEETQPNPTETHRKEVEGKEIGREGNGNANPKGKTSPTPRQEPPVEDCVKHAQHHYRANPEFAASVGRQFHALFARKNWQTSSGEDLLRGAAWKHRLNQMVEEESRKEIAKHPYAAATRSEGRGW